MILDIATGQLMGLVFESMFILANIVLCVAYPQQRFFRAWAVAFLGFTVTNLGLYVGMADTQAADLVGFFLLQIGVCIHMLFLLYSFEQSLGRKFSLRAIIIFIAILRPTLSILDEFFIAGLLYLPIHLLSTLGIAIPCFLGAFEYGRELRTSKLSARAQSLYEFMLIAALVLALVWTLRPILNFLTPEWTRYFPGGGSFFSVLALPPATVLLNISIILLLLNREHSRLESLRSNFALSENDLVFGQLLNNLNHGLNTPLGNALTAVSFALDKGTSPEQRLQGLKLVEANLEQISNLVKDRNTILQSAPPNLSTLSVGDMIAMLQRLTGYTAAMRNVQLVANQPELILSTSLKLILSFTVALVETLARRGGSEPQKIELEFEEPAAGQIRLSYRYPASLLKGSGLRRVDSSSLEAGIEVGDEHSRSKLFWLAMLVSNEAGSHFEILSLDEDREELVLNFNSTRPR